MALIDKLNAIADAIREKTGKEDQMTLSQMPDEISQIATAGGGVTLPELTNPASATDLALDKQLIGPDGSIVTGALNEVSTLIGLSRTPDSVSQNSSGEVMIQSGMHTPMDFIGRSNVKFRTRVPLTNFGDATADDVAKGKTFTSAAGLLMEGTREAGAGLSITDDGEGNVSIVSTGTVTIADDGAGNVTIE